MDETYEQDLLHELHDPGRSPRTVAPAPWEDFDNLRASVVQAGVLCAATKELIALSVAVISQSDGCIVAHARAAARAGATPQSVAEALAVTLLMGGEPASVYAARAWEAYLDHASPSMLAAAGVGFDEAQRSTTTWPARVAVAPVMPRAVEPTAFHDRDHARDHDRGHDRDPFGEESLEVVV